MLLKKINILKQKSWFPSIQEKKNGKKNLKTKNIYIYIYTPKDCSMTLDTGPSQTEFYFNQNLGHILKQMSRANS
jgi:hypothetical protein